MAYLIRACSLKLYLEKSKINEVNLKYIVYLTSQNLSQK